LAAAFDHRSLGMGLAHPEPNRSALHDPETQMSADDRNTQDFAPCEQPRADAPTPARTVVLG
jgi:hypothetical protein